MALTPWSRWSWARWSWCTHGQSFPEQGSSERHPSTWTDGSWKQIRSDSSVTLSCLTNDKGLDDKSPSFSAELYVQIWYDVIPDTNGTILKMFSTEILQFEVGLSGCITKHLRCSLIITNFWPRKLVKRHLFKLAFCSLVCGILIMTVRSGNPLLMGKAQHGRPPH
jgi:hypothetical protein